MLTMKHGFKVEYDDLVALKDGSTLENAVTAFHRFVGRADRIAQRYELYVELTNKLSALETVSDEIKCRLLPLLALATTGSRGSNGFNANAFFEIIQILATNDSAYLSMLLEKLHRFDGLVDNAKLSEAGGLIKLLHEDNASAATLTENLASLQAMKSTELLQALNLWRDNTVSISANDFIQSFQYYATFDNNKISQFSKIMALIKASKDSISGELNDLKQAISALQKTDHYDKALDILSSIDLKKTPYAHLPTVEKLITAINAAKASSDSVFAAISNVLTGCEFNRVGAASVEAINVSEELVKEVEKINNEAASYGITQAFDLAKLAGEAGSLYFKNRYKELKASVAQVPMAGTLLDKKAAKILELIYIKPITSLLNQFKGFDKLLEYFPAPALMTEKLEEFEERKKEIIDLFARLGRFRAEHWGNHFNLDFLINSPWTGVFGVVHTNEILSAIEDLNVSYVPTNLFEAVFPSNCKINNIDQNKLSEKLVELIRLKHFDVSQKTKLILMLKQMGDGSNIDILVTLLQNVQKDYSHLAKNVFDLFETRFINKENSELSILEEAQSLLAIFPKDNNSVLVELFKQLQESPELQQKLLKIVNEVPENKKQAFVKIVAYSELLQSDEEQTSILENLKNLTQESNQDFETLSDLFDQCPRPGLKSVERYVSLPSESRQAFLKELYEFDPPGLRANPKALNEQFDISGMVHRINAIRDLKTDKPLLKTQRKKLKKRIGSITAVGRTHPLVVPGMTFEEARSYKKPVKDLTKKQLKQLVQHYRAIISGQQKTSDDEKTNRHNKKLATLEFVALAREAMYRTTGKFPYSTQVLSLLAVMMQRGNVISEIRTGEGKGLITALFAATKWMEGGAVDVCSSNAELARRDLAEFSDFFEYIGIRTALIKTQMPYRHYQQDGINYSDVAEMALFQERMELAAKKLPDKVSLILDEADYTVLDNTTQFRYAVNLDTTHDPHTNPNEWVYPIILKFVEREDFLTNGHTDLEDIDDLRDYALELGDRSLDEFADVVLDHWIDSAYTASQLKQDVDFAIRDEKITRNGQEIAVKIARVKDKANHRVSDGSSFSDGVQQFLHTRLNLTDNNKLFPIEPEKTYLAAKSTKNFVDYYTRPQADGQQRGDVWGLTGTAGSEEEIKELGDKSGFKIIKMPPHKLLKRQDLKHRVAKPSRNLFRRKQVTQEELFHSIGNQVIQAYQSGQMVHLMNDDAKSSNALFAHLKEILSVDKVQSENVEHNGQSHPQINLRLYNNKTQFNETVIDGNYSKKAISPAGGEVRAPGFLKGRAQAPLESPSARVPRAGEILSVKKLGRLRPSFLYGNVVISTSKLKTDDIKPADNQQKTCVINVSQERAKLAMQQVHFARIKKRVIQTHKRQQPLLLVCDGVDSSQALFNYLNKTLSSDIKQDLQLYNGEQDPDVSEANVVAKAGKNGAITISTPMFGRGTDIKPENKQHGLCVIDTFIAPERDYGQIIGRAGRNGAAGLSRLIISEYEFVKRGMAIPTRHGALLAAIKEIQTEMSDEKKQDRTKREVFADVKDQFFQQYKQLGRVLKNQVKTHFDGIKADYRQSWHAEVQYNVHLQWEAFLRNIDGYWKAQITSMSNELSKLNGSDEQQLKNKQKEVLADKIKALTGYANKEWKLTHEKINNTANAVFEEEYQTAWQRVNPEQTLENDSIPTLTLLPCKAAVEQLSNIVTEEKPLVLNIDIAPLSEKDINLDSAYLEVSSQHLTEEARNKYANNVFAQEINAIYSDCFNRAPAADTETNTKLDELLTAILDRYYNSYERLYGELSRSRIITFYRRTMSMVEKYGNDESKQVVYKAHHNHINKSNVAQSGRYIQGLLGIMYQMHDRGILSKTADLSVMHRLGHQNEQAAWQSLYNYTDQKLRTYAGEWWKASDRKQALQAMQSALAAINRKEQTPSEKIKALVDLINQCSEEAIQQDYKVDKSRWRVRSFRNTDGSRFQITLDAIRAKAMIVATGIQQKGSKDPFVNFNSQVSYLKNLLAILKQRAQLPRVNSHPVINKLANDNMLASVISILNGDSGFERNYQNLQIIKECLSGYMSDLRKESLSNRSASTNAFVYLFNDVYARIIDMENALNHSHQRDFLYKPINRLRARLQSALQQLVKEDQVKKAGVDTSAYKSLLIGIEATDQMKALLQSVLFEIQRNVYLVYGKKSIVNFKFAELKYGNVSQTLQLSIYIQDKENIIRKILLEVNSLEHNSSEVICQWPKEKDISQLIMTSQSYQEELGYTDSTQLNKIERQLAASNPYSIFSSKNRGDDIADNNNRQHTAVEYTHST